MKKIVSVIMMAALLVASVPAMGGNVYAAKKPAKVKGVSLHAEDHTSIKLKWSKVKKGASGYTIYRNGKAIKNVGKSKKSYTDKGLTPSTKYTYYVKAYTNAKTKQWFNKKTGKWQTKKPAKKIRGKSRTVKKKLYGKASAKVSLATLKDPLTATWTYAGRTVKASECPVTFTISGTPCKICGGGGVVATVTYSNGEFSGEQEGTDYSKKCHHCDKFLVVKCYGAEPNIYFKTPKEIDPDDKSYDSGCEIDPATGADKGEMTFWNHKHAGQGKACEKHYPHNKIYFCNTCKKLLNDD